MKPTTRELQISPVADSVDLPLEGPWLPAALVRFVANVAQRLLPWAVPVGLIVLWQIASSSGWLSTRVLPEPLAVAQAFFTLAASGELWTHVLVSTRRALIGFACDAGALLGGATAAERLALMGYAADLGLAFQIRDDLLDGEGDSTATSRMVWKGHSTMSQGASAASLATTSGAIHASTTLRTLTPPARI